MAIFTGYVSHYQRLSHRQKIFTAGQDVPGQLWVVAWALRPPLGSLDFGTFEPKVHPIYFSIYIYTYEYIIMIIYIYIYIYLAQNWWASWGWSGTPKFRQKTWVECTGSRQSPWGHPSAIGHSRRPDGKLCFQMGISHVSSVQNCYEGIYKGVNL